MGICSLSIVSLTPNDSYASSPAGCCNGGTRLLAEIGKRPLDEPLQMRCDRRTLIGPQIASRGMGWRSGDRGRGQTTARSNTQLHGSFGVCSLPLSCGIHFLAVQLAKHCPPARQMPKNAPSGQFVAISKWACGKRQAARLH